MSLWSFDSFIYFSWDATVYMLFISVFFLFISFVLFVVQLTNRGDFIARLYFTHLGSKIVMQSSPSSHFVSMRIQTRRFFFSLGSLAPTLHSDRFCTVKDKCLIFRRFTPFSIRITLDRNWIRRTLFYAVCGETKETRAHSVAERKNGKRFVFLTLFLVDYLIHFWSSDSMCHLFYPLSFYKYTLCTIYCIQSFRFVFFFDLCMLSCQVHVCMYSDGHNQR